MSTRYAVDRRSLLIGGCSAALIGCGPQPGGSSEYGGGFSDSSSALPSWAADVGLFLTMASIAGPVGGAIAGALSLPRLAFVLRRIGALADQADWIPDAIAVVNQIRWERFAIPAANASPRPFAVPASGNINDFESVPLFGNDVTLQFGVLNEQGGNFGEHDIYATVRPVHEPPPRTLSEIWGTGDLPHAIVFPASNGSFDGRLDLGTLPPGAYVSYSWKVPRGQRPSDEQIASTAFIGPAFLSVASAGYTVDLYEDVETGRNVQARFQLPEAHLT